MTALTMLVTYKAKPGMRQTYVQQCFPAPPRKPSTTFHPSSPVTCAALKKSTITTFIFQKKMKTPCFW